MIGSRRMIRLNTGYALALSVLSVALGLLANCDGDTTRFVGVTGPKNGRMRPWGS